MKNAKDVPSNRWFAMTRLDENRAKPQLALKSGFHWRDVAQLAIRGNHSSTLFLSSTRASAASLSATQSPTTHGLRRILSKAFSNGARRSFKREVSPLPSPPRKE